MTYAWRVFARLPRPGTSQMWELVSPTHALALSLDIGFPRSMAMRWKVGQTVRALPCLRGHRPPGPRCACGLYAFETLGAIRDWPGGDVVALVEGIHPCVRGQTTADDPPGTVRYAAMRLLRLFLVGEARESLHSFRSQYGRDVVEAVGDVDELLSRARRRNLPGSWSKSKAVPGGFTFGGVTFPPVRAGEGR
jgi:hypothetical protein